MPAGRPTKYKPEYCDLDCDKAREALDFMGGLLDSISVYMEQQAELAKRLDAAEGRLSRVENTTLRVVK